MPESSLEHSEISALEERIAILNTKLAEAKQAVQGWVDANASLSRSAAAARAENQGAGRGLMGSLFGPKYRAVARRAAAASNAAIAKDVAAKRAQIADGKRRAQEVARLIQAEISVAKAELKSRTSRSRPSVRTEVAVAKAAVNSLELLQRLKEAKDAGLLTDAEFEEKRRKLVSGI